MFLTFMHTPERLKALYDQTGAFPADNRFDLGAIKDPLQRQMLTWDLTLPNIWLENFVPSSSTPTATDGRRNDHVGQRRARNIAAQLWERTARQWRVSNPGDLKHFQSWIGGKL